MAKRQQEQGWVKYFEGHDNFVRVSGLLQNSVYYFRVTAVNAADEAGDPSDKVVCRTAPTPALVPSNADKFFTIECTGDVVVGDTILFTERLYVTKDGKITPSENMTTFTRSGRPETSQPGGSKSTGQYIGERTIAAHVLKDTYRSSHQTQQVGLAKPLSRYQSTNVQRTLRLQVVWSTVSTEEELELRKDMIIQRDAERISEFETFRVPWHHEQGRLPEREEREICQKLLT